MPFKLDFGISTSWTENQAIQTLSGLKTSPVKLTHFKHWDPPTTDPHLISSQNLQYRLLLTFNAGLVGLVVLDSNFWVNLLGHLLFLNFLMTTLSHWLKAGSRNYLMATQKMIGNFLPYFGQLGIRKTTLKYMQIGNQYNSSNWQH